MEEQKTNHSQLPKTKQVDREKGVKAKTCLLDLDNGSSADISLIRRYNKFSNLCVAEGMRNIKEIAELFRVREELRLI